jgi:hypothetical protein
MPFKSKAQRRKFAELLVKGEITEEAYERWNQETGGAELPERVGARKRGKTTKARKTGGRAKRAKKVARRKGVTKTKRAAATRKRAKRAKRVP